MGQMGEALHWLKTDRKILLVGAQQALFEGAMYTFVFMWTPTLEVNGAKIPHGLIFAAFMVSCSLGGTYFGIFSERMELAKLMRWLYVIAAISMVVPIIDQRPLLYHVRLCRFRNRGWDVLARYRHIAVEVPSARAAARRSSTCSASR